MPQRPVRHSATPDLDAVEGAFELAEMAFGSLPAYHAAWQHLHRDDQTEYLRGLEGAIGAFSSLEAWDREGSLDAQHAERLAELRAQRATYARAEAELRGVGAPVALPRPSAHHPMILED